MNTFTHTHTHTHTHARGTESGSAESDSLGPQGLYRPWNSLGQNTGVQSLSLLQGIFPTQGSNPPALQVDSLPAEPQRKHKNTRVGSLSFLQWMFPRNGTRLSIAFFTSWAIQEAVCVCACVCVCVYTHINQKEDPRQNRD